jgi:hypothetical protein
MVFNNSALRKNENEAGHLPTPKTQEVLNIKFPDLNNNKIEGDESMQLARAIFKAS